MKTCKWQPDISALLDGALSPKRTAEVERHLGGCAECGAFHREQQEFAQLFLKASEFQLEPSKAIWNGIEARIAARNVQPSERLTWIEKLSDLLRVPQFGYGVAAVLLVLLTGVVAVEMRQPGAEDREVLSQLENFSIDTAENPFMRKVADENPFFTYEAQAPRNPFTDRGVTR